MKIDKSPKPHKWRPATDAQRCCACGENFKKGDLVFDNCMVNFHAAPKCIKKHADYEKGIYEDWI